MDRQLFRTPDIRRNNKRENSVKAMMRIAVVGASTGSGASLVAGAIACALRTSEAVALAELGTAYFYQALGMEKRFLNREFTWFYRLLENREAIRDKSNMEQNINWVLKAPFENVQPEFSGLFRLINNVQGAVCIFDCSGLDNETLFHICPDMDAVVVVIDPMPTRLMQGFALLERIRLSYNNAVFVVNKMNRGVHVGELSHFLGLRDFVTFPFIKPEALYKAEYNCVLPMDMSDVAAELSHPCNRLIKRILTEKS